MYFKHWVKQRPVGEDCIDVESDESWNNRRKGVPLIETIRPDGPQQPWGATPPPPRTRQEEVPAGGDPKSCHLNLDPWRYRMALMPGRYRMALMRALVSERRATKMRG